MSVVAVASVEFRGFWRRLWDRLCGRRAAVAAAVAPVKAPGAVPPPPLIEVARAGVPAPSQVAASPEGVAAAAPRLGPEIAIPAPVTTVPPARRPLMLAARLASASALNPPKRRAGGKTRPNPSRARKAATPLKARRKKDVTKPKAVAPRRHVWLSGGPVSTPAHSAEVIRLTPPGQRGGCRGGSLKRAA